MERQAGVAGVILAGGEGRRMGGADKAMLMLGGATLLARAVARLGPQVGDLAVSANGDPSRFAGLRVLADPVPGLPGPLAGLLAGMDWAAGLGAARLATVAVDTPFVPRDLVARLGAVAARVAVASDGARLHPTAGLWDVALRDRLRADLAAGARRLGDWAVAAGAVAVAFDARDAFANINTPSDLAAAAAMLDADEG